MVPNKLSFTGPKKTCNGGQLYQIYGVGVDKFNHIRNYYASGHHSKKW